MVFILFGGTGDLGETIGGAQGLLLTLCSWSLLPVLGGPYAVSGIRPGLVTKCDKCFNPGLYISSAPAG